MRAPCGASPTPGSSRQISALPMDPSSSSSPLYHALENACRKRSWHDGVRTSYPQYQHQVDMNVDTDTDTDVESPAFNSPPQSPLSPPRCAMTPYCISPPQHALSLPPASRSPSPPPSILRLPPDAPCPPTPRVFAFNSANRYASPGLGLWPDVDVDIYPTPEHSDVEDDLDLLTRSRQDGMKRNGVYSSRSGAYNRVLRMPASPSPSTSAASSSTCVSSYSQLGWLEDAKESRLSSDGFTPETEAEASDEEQDRFFHEAVDAAEAQQQRERRLSRSL